MVKKRHISPPVGVTSTRFRGQTAGLRTALVACAGVAALFASPAFAQSAQNTQSDRPVTATGATDAPRVATGVIDVRPETLSAPLGRTLNPKDMKAVNYPRSNRWNPQTLTQPTRLSAVGQGARRGSLKPSVSGLRTDTLPTDTLSAQKLLSSDGQAQVKITNQQQVTGRKDGVINLSSSLRGALFDLPTNDNVNASVFKLDLAGRPCLGTATECRANDVRRIDFGYAKNITKGKKNGFNLQMTPHGGLRVDDEEKSALVGALVRIGDNLREGSEMKSNTWYLFAGADAEAVTYTPNSVRKLTSGDFHLQDRIIIGDAQAGVGYRLGDADLALTYFKRQATAENYSYDEDAAALSITWKR